MTDARLRGEWLNSMRFDALSDTAWRVFTSGLMWAAENGTNGLVPNRYLRMLHPNGEQTEACQEIVTASLGVLEPTGLVFLDWDGALGQSTAFQVETYKANGRKRQRDYRERQRSALVKTSGLVVFEAEASATPVTRYSTGDVTTDKTRDVGTGKGKGKGGLIGDDLSEVGEQTGEVSTPVTSWTSALPGSGELTSEKAFESPKSDSTPSATCRVCGSTLFSQPALASGLCRKGDAAHVAYRERAAA